MIVSLPWILGSLPTSLAGLSQPAFLVQLPRQPESSFFRIFFHVSVLAEIVWSILLNVFNDYADNSHFTSTAFFMLTYRKIYLADLILYLDIHLEPVNVSLFGNKILQMYLCFFLEISNVFMMSAFIAALDKKAKDIRINHLCIPLCSACRSGGWEWVHPHILPGSWTVLKHAVQIMCLQANRNLGLLPFQWS